MTESQLVSFLAIFFAGVIIGILATLLFNKVRSGRASAGAVKREFDDYQSKVEEHFDETSEKFKAMAEQYKDLYQHLSVGATSLCRPEHVVAGLSDQSDPLQPLPKPEPKPEPKPNAASDANKSSAKIDGISKSKSEDHSAEKTAKSEQKKPPSPQPKQKSKENSAQGKGDAPAAAGPNANLKKTPTEPNKTIKKPVGVSSKKV